MKRVPPSAQMHEAVEELLHKGLSEEGSVVGELIRLGAERVLQEMVEGEVADFLAREYSQRRQAGEELRGYRNGYRPKAVRTAEGAVEVQVPELRQTVEPFHSQVVDFLERNTDVLERLVGDFRLTEV